MFLLCRYLLAWLGLFVAGWSVAGENLEYASLNGASAAEVARYIDLAIANDERIATARADIVANEAGVDAASAPNRPQVIANGSYSWTEQQQPLQQGHNNAEASLDVQQSLWQRSQANRRDLAFLRTEASRMQLAKVTQELLGELGRAFFDVLNQYQIVETRKVQLQSLANSLEREEARFATGVSSAPQLGIVRAEYNQENARLIAAEALQSTYLDLLQRLIGAPVQLPQVGSKKPVFGMPKEGLQAWQDRAAGENIDLRLLDNAIAQSNLHITLAQRGNDPSLYLFGRWARASNPSGMGAESEYQQIGVRLSVPLYTGGGVTAATTQAEQGYVSAQLMRDRQTSIVDSTVRIRWRQLESQLAVIEANQVSLLSASQLLELNQAAYRNNALSQQDLLDAQSRFFVANNLLSSSKYDFSRKLIELYLLAGDLDKQRLLEVVGVWL